MGLKSKLFMAVATSAAGAAMIAGGTFAYFNSTATIQSNTFAAGTVTLNAVLDPTSSGYSTTTTGFNVTNMAPGQSFTETYNLSNKGTLNIGDLTAKFKYTPSMASNAAFDPNQTATTEPADLGSQLYINSITVGGQNVTSNVESQLGITGQLTVADLNGKVLDFGSLGTLKAQSGTTSIVISGDFNDATTPQNYYQGSSLSGDVTFVGTQAQQS